MGQALVSNTAQDRLVAHWSFDTSAAGSFSDESGNGFTAVSAGLGVTKGIKGNALNCNSASFDIVVTNSVGNFMLPKFTIEAWINSNVNLVNPGSGDNFKHIFDFAHVGPSGSGDGGGFVFQISDRGKLELGLTDPTKSTTWIVIVSDSTLYPNRWYQVAATYDGLKMRLFINGQLVKEMSNSFGRYLSSDIPARIGCCYRLSSGTQGVTANHFSGTIDEMKLYNYALDSAAVADSYFKLSNNKPCIVAHWSFDSSAQGNYFDVSGNGYTAVSSGLGTGKGVRGKALVCDSSAFDIQITNSVGNFEFPKFSIETWLYSEINLVNPGSFNNFKKIFDYAHVGLEGSNDGGGYGLHISDRGKVELSLANPERSPTWITITSDSSLLPRKWYHIAATYDNYTMRLYINGKLIKEREYTQGFLPSDIAARIGCEFQITSGTSGRVRTRFVGKIDEMKVYNYALDPQAVSASYTTAKPSEEPPFEINLGMKTAYALPGDTILMPIFITNYEDFVDNACQFNFSFTSRIAELSSITIDSGVVRTWPLFNWNQKSADSVSVAIAGVSTPIRYGEGELVRCIFKIKSDAANNDTCSINLHNIPIDETNKLILATSTSGKIIIRKPEVLYGDVTGNKIVDLFDAQKVLAHVVGAIPIPNVNYPNFTTVVADVSGNGSITSYDAALIFQHSIGLLPVFPVGIHNIQNLKKQLLSATTPVAEIKAQIENVAGSELKYIVTGTNLRGLIGCKLLIGFNPSIVDMSRGSVSTLVRGAKLTSRIDSEKNELCIGVFTGDDVDVDDPVTLASISLPPVSGMTTLPLYLNSVQVNEGKIQTNIGMLTNNIKQIESFETTNLKPVVITCKDVIVISMSRPYPFDISVWSLSGRCVLKKHYNANKECVAIATGNLAIGSYIYQISNSYSIQNGKILITR